ncbi:unnamed protein product [Cuscuta campestris]|uniref:Uncharacterized protein n=1 Tax=Cuscuta campestris TaxID=132261 RepID=A0A484NDB7_9ASTE|nr:unnamed protein product [Cuscuta campestris]
MEIPDLNMISDFEAGVKCLQNPSLISSSLPISGIGRSFWKWGALILALVATFRGIIRRIKLFFFYIRAVKPSVEPLLQYLSEDFDFSDSDGEEDSSCSSSEEEEVVRRATTSFAGRLRNRRRRETSVVERFPWSGFASGGKSVVKLWDNLAVGYDFDAEVFMREVYTDLNLTNKVFPESRRSTAMASPAVVVSSEVIGSRNDVVVAAYDTRLKGRSPAICAEWQTPAKISVDVNAAGVERVYVEDRAAGVVTVGDLRNMKTALGELTEVNVETWWDAGALTADDA